MLGLLLIALSCCLAGLVSGQASSPVVTTSYGQVVGNRKQDDTGLVFDEFLGIPYASPPVGDLRWQKTVAPSAWEGVREAKTFSAHCIQFTSGDYPENDGVTDEDSEDCLYLNIWVSGGVNPESPKRPVMVFFHGGGFLFGTGALFPGYELGRISDVIVVTFNYRLSTLGFLSTMDSNAPGNYGLWDGKAALEWVQSNIALFGGDPSYVTIFGHSAGSVLVSHTGMSPATKGLFNNTFCLSGAASGAFGYGIRPREFLSLLAEQFDCPVNDSAATLECLRQEEAEDLDLWGIVAPVTEGYIPSWLPVIDGDFLAKEPRQSIIDGAASQYNMITGRTLHDAANFVFMNLRGANMTGNGAADDKEELEFAIRVIIRTSTFDENGTYNALLRRYPGVMDDDAVVRSQAVTQAATDWLFSSPAHLESSLYSQVGKSSAYLFEYQHRPNFVLFPSWVNGTHGNDLYSVFGDPFRKFYRRNTFENEGPFNEDDLRMRDTLMNYLHNFARSGNPNQGRQVPASWPAYNDNDKQFARLSAFMTSSSIETETPDMLERFKFWNDVTIGRTPEIEEDFLPSSSKEHDLTDILEAVDRIFPLFVPDYEAARDRIKDRIVNSYRKLQMRKASRAPKTL